MFLKFAHDRCQELENPLHTLAAPGAVAPDGLIQWLGVGRYDVIENSDDHITQVTHRGTGVHAAPSTVGIVTGAFALIDPHDDLRARFEATGFPPVYLAAWFGDEQGPKAVENFAGKGKLLQQRADETFAEWETATDKRTGGGAAADSVGEIVQSIVGIEHEVTRARLVNAQAAAKSAAAKSKARRTCDI